MLFIQDAVDTGKITPQLATLFNEIHSITSDPAATDLYKIKAVLALRESLSQENFKGKRVAYLGSRYDWQFAVALGAREIDLVDKEVFNKRPFEIHQNLEPTIRKFDPDFQVPDDDLGSFKYGYPKEHEWRFTIDVGDGLEDVVLRLHNNDVREYVSPTPIGGIIQMAGGNGMEYDKPILPNISSQMQEGATVLNFDHMRRGKKEDFPGLQRIDHGDYTFYKVSANIAS